MRRISALRMRLTVASHPNPWNLLGREAWQQSSGLYPESLSNLLTFLVTDAEKVQIFCRDGGLNHLHDERTIFLSGQGSF
jgi:hypothetical protein